MSKKETEKHIHLRELKGWREKNAYYSSSWNSRNNWTFLFIHWIRYTNIHWFDIQTVFAFQRDFLDSSQKWVLRLDLSYECQTHKSGWGEKKPQSTPNHKCPTLLLWCFPELKRWKYKWRSKSHGATNTVSERGIKALATGNNIWKKNHDLHHCRNKRIFCCWCSAVVSWG